MLVIGKGLGGGVFPIAALIAREGLYVAGNRARGNYTHEKSPVACAAALATIRYVEENRLAEHARELGQHALGRMAGLMERHPLIGISAAWGSSSELSW
jgi:4-aminobutyrate aminotransferase